MTATRNRRPVPDRARKRAIRALAAELGVAYSVAARLHAAQTPSGRPPAESPAGADEHRAWMSEARAGRTFHARVNDTRLAAGLPLGRAEHLVRRFPPLRAITAAGPLYAGEGRETIIAMLYAVLAHESPALLPPPDELTWAAELGEEAAVDIACAALDRAARQLLDQGRWQLWARVETALTAGESDPDRRVRDAAGALGRELRSTSLRGSLEGVRHILDAVLVEPFGALAPGIRVRVDGQAATVIGAEWELTGPPARYRVRVDNEPLNRIVPAAELDAGTAPEPDLIPG
ncbi:hypothetical protein [Actinoplanes sp. NPDC020271]|uniref:hypothetical protein n=1 Tax=Actinoplanes sp. NPDC020271 TaxID=3363896 RepID=UPI00379EB290